MSSFKQKLSCLKYLHAISTGGNLSIPQIPSSPICWYRLGLTVFFNHDIEEGQRTRLLAEENDGHSSLNRRASSCG